METYKNFLNLLRKWTTTSNMFHMEISELRVSEPPYDNASWP